jgi:hypothetical protein
MFVGELFCLFVYIGKVLYNRRRGDVDGEKSPEDQGDYIIIEG